MLHGMNERRAAHRGLERRLGPTPSSMLTTTTNALESLLSTDSAEETTLTIRRTSTSSVSVTSTSATSSATSSETTTSTHTSSTSTSSSTSTTTTLTTTSSTQSTTTSLSTSSSSSSSSSHTSSSSTLSAEATISSTHTTGTVSVTVSSSTNVAASASASSTGRSSNTGAIIGGVAAGIIGLALVIGIIGFFLRRWRTKRRDRDEFDASTFRRSAVLMHDPPPDSENDRPFNPRPPSMLERRNHPMSFGMQYGAPGPVYAPPERSQAYYDTGMSRDYSPSPAANSANPLFALAMYRQADETPRPSPAPIDTSQYVYSHDLDDGPLPSPVYGLGGPTIPASPPANRASENTTASVPRSVATYDQSVYRPSMASSTLPANDYIDVTRSSVTPFQAAQYVEIANRLATEVPQGLDTPAVNEYVHSRNASLATNGSGTPPVVPPKDGHYSQASTASPKRTSAQSQASVDIMKDLEFPTPPSPVLSTSSRYRVDSTPPTLPEISIDRGSVSQYSLPISYRDSTSSTPTSSPFPGSGSGFPSGVSQTITVGGKLGPQSRFPTTPSPLGNSFVMTSPPAEGDRQLPSSPTPSSPTIPVAKRPETIYDADDAYGGI
ncbi:uncharacterized protein EV420DRAFT_1474251 [Desarmillaria tabescens]|uniref:REJ domain-containing protein n=1 Tax=Armillaria tabescens TaxID=1929756 RepID=A0AA39NJK5_ARMTA|nr:uncharacterized protein EV420DRAFT_1474251 [Desarmillaria tabescens]KAK0466824.1 hypothetical protein EV420DRAFT_1474251 [Desarmillaria tabescens]